MKFLLPGITYFALTACGVGGDKVSNQDVGVNAETSNADVAHSESALAEEQSVEKLLTAEASSMAAACGADSVKEYLITRMDQEIEPFYDSLFVKAHEPEVPYEVTSEDIEAAKENLDSPMISKIAVRQINEKIDKVECSASLSISSATGQPRAFRIEYDLQPAIGEAGYLVSSDLDLPRGAWRVAIEGYAKGLAKKRAADSLNVQSTEN